MASGLDERLATKVLRKSATVERLFVLVPEATKSSLFVAFEASAVVVVGPSVCCDAVTCQSTFALQVCHLCSH